MNPRSAFVRSFASSDSATATPTIAPKPVIDVKHILQNADLHRLNCRERNYPDQTTNLEEMAKLSSRIQSHTALRTDLQREAKQLQESIRKGADGEEKLSEQQSQARALKEKLNGLLDEMDDAARRLEQLALAFPNLSFDDVPRGSEPEILSYFNEPNRPFSPAANGERPMSHVDIGKALGILDFASAGHTSGWGWYYLVGGAAQLEQALVSYALAVASRHGWRQVSPPTMVYSHIASACGFQPRDAHGEQQVYRVAQSDADRARGVPEMSMVGTSEIALAGMRAKSTIPEDELPLRRVAVSRCFRAEAGARGADTRGLYRVHEFTKVEMFAWTGPDADATTDVFDEMVDIQTEILESLGLHVRVLEMPTQDLGASAARKIDMETFFPGRVRAGDESGESGWGEVTSASVCTDYQTRRLATRMKRRSGKLDWPWTLNGTAMAVPRVLAALLEKGWDGEGVVVPEVLRPWMDGREKITRES